MVGRFVESILDAANPAGMLGGCGDGAGDPELLDFGHFVGVKKIDTGNAQFPAPFGELRKRGAVEAPTAHGVLDGHGQFSWVRERMNGFQSA